MQLLSTYRARFGKNKDIVAEFMPSSHLLSKKVAILTPGCPSYPGNKEMLMHMLVRLGFMPIIPRYRGTWESDGSFLEHSPHEDVLQVMDDVTNGFFDVWSTAEYKIENPEFYLLGGSFGGPAAILASRDARVKKAITISGVVDWQAQQHTVEPLEYMSQYLPKAFGNAYRADPSVWEKLAVGDFYNPAHEAASIDGKKLLMIHAKDDAVVHIAPSVAFAEKVGARLITLPRGGHMGVGSATLSPIWKWVAKTFTAKETR